MSSERGKNAIAVATFFLVAAVLVLGAWKFVGSDALRDCSFDEQAWSEGQRTSHPSERYEAMEEVAEDLVKCDDLVYDKSPAAVRDLLGPPDSTSRVQRSWYYDIGIPPPNSDYPGLLLQYGRDGAVTSVEIPGFVEK